jgi:phospholipase/carboxylesterase
MRYYGTITFIAAILFGCGPKMDVQEESNRPITIGHTTTAPKSGQTFAGTRTPPRVTHTAPSGSVAKMTEVTNHYSGFKSMHVSEAKPGHHRATLIYLHARTGNGLFESQLLLDKGLLNGLTSQVRIVAPQYNNYEWFPFINVPGGDIFGPPGNEGDVNKAFGLLTPIVEHEASLLGGDYSKIFLYGFSQGAMMATWTGLMMDRNFGGVVSFAGSLPIFNVVAIPPNSRNVPIFHLHDPEDTTVRFQVAKTGYEVARRAGASGYAPIHETVVGGKMRHSLSFEAIMETNDWLVQQLKKIGVSK